MLQSGSPLMQEHTELDFNHLVEWDIDALSTDFATWMAVDSVHPAATSRVGILSSAECQILLHEYLEEDLCTSFRLLIKVSSLLYNRKDRPHPHYELEQLDLIRSSIGAKLLTCLEMALKNTALAKASKEKLMSLFLVLLGAIIAVTYTTATGLEEARYELLRILAHHMIFLAERIGLMDCDSTKQRLTASCHNLWNKVGAFNWDYTTCSATEDPNSTRRCRADASNLDVQPKFSSTVEATNIGAPQSGQHSEGLSPAATMTLEWPQDLPANIFNHQMGNFSVAASCNLVQHDGLTLNTTLQSTARLSTPYGLLENAGLEHGSSLVPMELTVCHLCNGHFPSDEMCPACFGPFPGRVGCSDVANQTSFGSMSPVPDFKALDSAIISQDAAPISKGPERRQSDASIENNLQRRKCRTKSWMSTCYSASRCAFSSKLDSSTSSRLH